MSKIYSHRLRVTVNDTDLTSRPVFRSHRNEISVLMDTNSIARVAKELQMLKSKRTVGAITG